MDERVSVVERGMSVYKGDSCVLLEDLVVCCCRCYPKSPGFIERVGQF